MQRFWAQRPALGCSVWGVGLVPRHRSGAGRGRGDGRCRVSLRWSAGRFLPELRCLFPIFPCVYRGDCVFIPLTGVLPELILWVLPALRSWGRSHWITVHGPCYVAVFCPPAFRTEDFHVCVPGVWLCHHLPCGGEVWLLYWGTGLAGEVMRCFLLFCRLEKFENDWC